MRTRAGRVLILLAVILAVMLCMFQILLLPAQTTHANTPTLDYDVSLTQIDQENLGQSDARLGIAFDGTYYYRLYYGYETTNHPSDESPLHVRKATSISGLWTAGQYVDKPVTGDQPRWPVGLYYNKSDGYFYFATHEEIEYYYNFHYRKIRFEKADLKSDTPTATNLGDAITSDSSTSQLATDYNGRYVDDGPGDEDFFVDDPNGDGSGYAYIYYDTPFFNDFNIGGYAGPSKTLPVAYPDKVARIKLSDLTNIHAWHKFYQGAWNEPGQGGHDSALNNNGGEEYVFYSKTLNRYVMLTRNNYTQYATNLDTQNWSPELQLKTPGVTDNFEYVPTSSLIDLDTGDPYRVGNNVLAISSAEGDPSTIWQFHINAVTPYYTTIRPPVQLTEPYNGYQQPYDPEFNGTPVPPLPSQYISFADPSTLLTSHLGSDPTQQIPTYADYGCCNATMYKATGPGDYVDITVNVNQPGTYRVYSYDKTFLNGAQWQLSINGVNQGAPIDLYDNPDKFAEANNGTYFRRFDLGYVTFATAGPVTLKFTLVGRNAHAQRWDGHFEGIRFEQVADQFNSTNLDGQWSITRQDSSNWSLSANPGNLRITTTGGSLTGSSNNASNVFLRKVYKARFPYGNWDIATRVNLASTSDGQAAGVIAYGDDDNFAQLALVQNGGSRQVQATLEQNGTDVVDTAPAPTGSVYLHINKTNDRYTFFYGTDGQNWTQLAQHQANLGSDWPQVGLVADGAAGATADFDWFDLRSKNYQEQGLSSHVYKRPVQTDSQTPGHDGAYAIDGDPSTTWIPADGNAHSITIDMGEHYRVNGTDISFADTSFAFKYKVEFSGDGSNWSTAVDRTGNTEAGALLEDVLTPQHNVQYVRLTVSGDSSHIPAVKEFNVYASAPEDPYNYDLPPLPGGDPTPTATSTPGSTPTPVSGGWTFCANEGGTCTVSGTQTVRFGANGTYVTQTVTGSIGCNNTAFGGDPLPNVVKHCDISSN